MNAVLFLFVILFGVMWCGVSAADSTKRNLFGKKKIRIFTQGKCMSQMKNKEERNDVWRELNRSVKLRKRARDKGDESRRE